jgi:hypothetical protein
VTPEQDQLISQSLICLRVCLETLGIKGSGPLGEELHILCEGFYCNVNCIAHLTSALTFYLDELSRVFFKKNMRNKSWWLSAFYSLCIQSKVRRCLIELITAEPRSKETLGAKQYLQLAVRLFVGSSGVYDPLVQVFSSEPVSWFTGVLQLV